MSKQIVSEIFREMIPLTKRADFYDGNLASGQRAIKVSSSLDGLTWIWPAGRQRTQRQIDCKQKTYFPLNGEAYFPTAFFFSAFIFS